MEQHLTFPTFVPEEDSPPIASGSGSSSATRSDRLYIGNLHPTVDEYTLLQLFNKHGRVIKLDFLFHKTGPQKGRPRGYAFVEFADKEVRQRRFSGRYARPHPGAGRSEGTHRRARQARPRTQTQRDVR